MIERLNHLIQGDIPSIDIYEVVDRERFKLEVPLVDGWSILIFEIYQIEDYTLTIEYFYLLRNPSGDIIYGYDNAPHHPYVMTFPHHKHRYPRDQFRPTEFSGQFVNFLEDVIYEIQR